METVLWDKVKRLISLKQEPIFFEIKTWLDLEVKTELWRLSFGIR